MIKGFFEDRFYLEMANIRPEDDTGLPYVIWIQESSGKEKHFARIKVSRIYGNKISPEEGFFTITVPDKEVIGDMGKIRSVDVELGKKWIDLNLDLILQYWNHEISTKAFLMQMKPYVE
jgi:hypothetical protein